MGGPLANYAMNYYFSTPRVQKIVKESYFGGQSLSMKRERPKMYKIIYNFIFIKSTFFCFDEKLYLRQLFNQKNEIFDLKTQIKP
jgi:hypothetical protein